MIISVQKTQFNLQNSKHVPYNNCKIVTNSYYNKQKTGTVFILDQKSIIYFFYLLIPIPVYIACTGTLCWQQQIKPFVFLWFRMSIKLHHITDNTEITNFDYPILSHNYKLDNNQQKKKKDFKKLLAAFSKKNKKLYSLLSDSNWKFKL